MSQLILLAGSLGLTRLPTNLEIMILERVSKGAEFCVGDAPGADLLFQKLFFEKGIKSVTVYHSDSLRYNLGKWPTLFVESNLKSRGRDKHTVKDRQMCRQSQEGFVAWDGQSAGTLANVFDLVGQGKNAQVFVGSRHVGMFSTRREVEEFCAQSSTMIEALSEAKDRLERFHKRELKFGLSRQTPLF